MVDEQTHAPDPSQPAPLSLKLCRHLYHAERADNYFGFLNNSQKRTSHLSTGCYASGDALTRAIRTP